jgi:NADH-quinone oxidoreductase subunit M
MFGKITNPLNEKLEDMNWREMATLAPLIVLAFWIGLYPKPFFTVLEKPVSKLVETINRLPPVAQEAQLGERR